MRKPLCKKCQFPNGMIIKPDGENELDPCLYETKQVFTNCIVEICKCRNCGNISVSWRRAENTEEIPESDWNMILGG